MHRTPFLLIMILASPVRADDPTFVTVKGYACGAQADAIGPIGGGKGYTRVVTEGDLAASNLDELVDALAKAKAGQTVFIPGETMIDCTARVYIEELVLQIPAGVTLAGNRGHEGSKGALLCSDALKTRPLIRIMGPGVRITGLRIEGPNPKRYLDHHQRSFAEGRGHEYYYKFPVSDGIQTEHAKLEVDNCEITAWSHGGVNLMGGEGHHIHHCFIHHCQYAGLGYGICHDTASSLIERNLFDANRHSIAGTGRPGCTYEARHNVELGTSLSHCFDMHGGRDRKDGTDIAGTKILIHHNTFRAPETPVVIRGVPQDECRVTNNWFVKHKTAGEAVQAHERTIVEDNAYGPKPAEKVP
jgi:hypothetical protein